jgi:AcrR family transcriptional regulator
MVSTNQANDRASNPTRSRRHAPEEARQLIQDAATRFFRDRPFRELTVADLMADTPLSRPAFYQYFDDLHHLIRSLLDEIQQEMLTTANPWIHGEGEPVAALREALRGVAETASAHGHVLRAITEAAPLDPGLEAAWNDFMGRWDDAVEARILVQQAAGLIPPLDARRMAVALNKLDAAVLVAEFGDRPGEDVEEVLETLHRIWVGALYSPQRENE